MIRSSSIDVSWRPRDQFHMDEDQSILALIDMVQEYLRALERLDQRFANLGYWKRSPDVANMPREKLLKRAQKLRDLGFEFDNRAIKDRLDVSINFGHPSNRVSSRATVRLGYRHPMMCEDTLLRDIIQLGIEFWRGDDAGIYYLDVTKSDDWFFWLRWQRDGVETPIPNVTSAGIPASTEPWLGGTLKTWPEHAPWLLLDAG